MSFVRVAAERGIAVVALARAAQRNAVNPAMAKELDAAFARIETDTSIKAAVLTGDGDHFCAGYDLRSVAAGAVDDIARAPHAPMGPSRRTVSKPVVAAIEGYCVAGGLELALLCDLRVASRTAIFGVYCRRFGVPLIDGGTVRLPALIGYSRAMDMILTGRSVKAEEAHQFGLANRVVDPGQALSEAMSIAESIASFPNKCMLADRASAEYATFAASSKDDALAHEFQQGCKVLSESVAGAQNFVKGSFSRDI
eukprot:m.91843 g.91843  ORF g.91843 m.91843 type:complete len:254 (+) comp8619_c0_seq2:1925-2686(+)